jgi:hypothetical protein
MRRLEDAQGTVMNVLGLAAAAWVATAPLDDASIRSALDRWFDARFDAPPPDVKSLAAATKGRSLTEIEALVRGGRASYPPPLIAPGTLVDGLPLACDHVDYATTMSLQLPKELRRGAGVAAGDRRPRRQRRDEPGYATHGRDEPYGITDNNRKMKAWLGERGFDWTIVEKPGGHEIFAGEVPRVFDFFAAHPRDLYRPRVLARGGGSMKVDAGEPKKPSWPEHTWRSDRPIELQRFHWVELVPAKAGTPAANDLQEVFAEWKPGNRIELTTSKVRELRLWLHPKMVDLSKPIELLINGEKRKVTAKPSLEALLSPARALDDRGRLFHARLDVKIATDRAVPEPSGAAER